MPPPLTQLHHKTDLVVDDDAGELVRMFQELASGNFLCIGKRWGCFLQALVSKIGPGTLGSLDLLRADAEAALRVTSSITTTQSAL
jgi:hypothetical protein